MTSQPHEPTLADVQHQYPHWHCSRDTSGRYHARCADTRPGDHAHVKGEDPLDLRDQIQRAEALQEQ